MKEKKQNSKKPKYELVLRDGRWFENGRWLPKKDYVYKADCYEGSSIISNITGQLYRLRNSDGRISIWL